jgi:predicted ribosomally synthesized peptide with nif11-like leader
MSQGNALAFIARVNKDSNLQAKLRPLAADDITGLLKIAAETGLEFTAEDYLVAIQARSIAPASDLSDDDLEEIAGGIGSATGGAGAGKSFQLLGIAITSTCTGGGGQKF